MDEAGKMKQGHHVKGIAHLICLEATPTEFIGIEPVHARRSVRIVLEKRRDTLTVVIPPYSFCEEV